MGTMKALIKNKAAPYIGDMPKPGMESDIGVLIRVALTGICRTDIYVAEDIIPGIPAPLILGHEFSGIVEETGVSVSHVAAGDRVTVMPLITSDGSDKRHPYAHHRMLGLHRDGCFCDFAMVPANAVYKIPDNVTLKQAAYMEPIAASLAVLNSGIKPGEKGIVYGNNRIAELTLRIMRIKGYENTEIYDPDRDQPIPEYYYDFIIETMASSESIRSMINGVRPGGRIVLKSRQWQPVSFQTGELVRKDINLSAVHYGDFTQGIRLISDGTLRVDDLLGEVRPLEEFARMFKASKHAESEKLFLTTDETGILDA